MIQVFMIDSSPLREELFFEKIYQGLSKERKEKVDAIKSPSGKRLSAAAGYLHDQYKDTASYYNLSHSGDLAVIAVANQPVGVDVEQIQKPKEAVMRKCYSKEEQHLIASDASFASLYFTSFWTQKESACKRSREGLAGILRSAGGLCDSSLSFQSVIKKLGEKAYVVTVAYQMPT